MKEKIKRLLLLIMVLQGCRCNSVRNSMDSFTTIRYNYFDTASFNMQPVDTNKFDLNLLTKIRGKVDFADNARCLFVEMISEQVPIREYTLYDYGSEKYFFATNRDKNFSFEEVTDTTVNDLKWIRSIRRNDIDVLQALATSSQQTKIKNDFGYCVANIMQVRNDQIQIRSFYLQRLPQL